jgi:hypothetical protein
VGKTAINVSPGQNMLVTFTVKNNENFTLTNITYDDLNGIRDTSLPNSCSDTLGPGSQCTLGINATVTGLGINQVTFNPNVCAFSRSACSTPIIPVKVNLLHNWWVNMNDGWNIPNPDYTVMDVNKIIFANHSLYAATEGGVYQFDFYNPDWKWESLKIPYANAHATTLTFDISTNTLYAAIESGVNSSIYSYNTVNKKWLPIGNLSGHTRVLLMLNKHLYAATQYGVWELTNATWSEVGDTNLDAYSLITHNNQLYVGANNGVWYFTSKQWIEIPGSQKLNKIRALVFHNDDLFVGTQDSGVCWWNGGWRHLIGSGPNANNRNITEGKVTALTIIKGVLYAATYSRNNLEGGVWDIKINTTNPNASPWIAMTDNLASNNIISLTSYFNKSKNNDYAVLYEGSFNTASLKGNGGAHSFGLLTD